MKKTYLVSVHRVTYDHSYFEVEAGSEGEAKEVAEQQAWENDELRWKVDNQDVAHVEIQ